MRAVAPLGAPTGWTMCSGIGAPEMAAPWVDWRLGSEIEEFPRAVLQERFGYKTPENHNQGDPLLWADMTEITPDLARSKGVPLPDLLVAGTPCQAFSIAGLRKGTADARGNLTLKFVETCHAIVDARPDGKLAVLWENVPGVLSDKANAFGCFLGGIVGADHALSSPDGGSWPGAGMVSGPRARATWRVLDAQFFGVAQRRRRVFVVVDFGDCIDPAAVLFERKSLRGDPAPRREAGQGSARGFECGPSGGGFTDLAPTLDMGCKDGRIRNQLGVGVISSTGEVAHCLNAGGMGRQDYETETMIAHTLRGQGFDASEDGTGRGTPLVPVAFQDRFRGDDGRGYNRPPPMSVDVTGSLETVKPWNVAVQVAGAICKDSFTGGAGGRPDGAAGGHFLPSSPWAVRRLTPTECARLQGFPDDHCRIPWRNKPADDCPDGPQYKALGNSMAVPCIGWILDRIRISAGWAA